MLREGNFLTGVCLFTGTPFSETAGHPPFPSPQKEDTPTRQTPIAEGRTPKYGQPTAIRILVCVPPKKLSFRFRISLSDMTNYKSADF